MTFLGGKKTIQQERSGQKGLQHAHKSYIHNIMHWQNIMNEENIKVEGKVDWPQALHVLTVHTKDKNIVKQKWLSTAGLF